MKVLIAGRTVEIMVVPAEEWPVEEKATAAAYSYRYRSVLLRQGEYGGVSMREALIHELYHACHHIVDPAFGLWDVEDLEAVAYTAAYLHTRGGWEEAVQYSTSAALMKWRSFATTLYRDFYWEVEDTAAWVLGTLQGAR